MSAINNEIARFLSKAHPYDTMPANEIAALSGSFSRRRMAQGDAIYAQGDLLDGLYLIEDGTVEITDGNGTLVSILQPLNHFGERGLLRDGKAATNAIAATDVTLLILAPTAMRAQMEKSAEFARYFNRGQARHVVPAPTNSLTTRHVADLMARNPLTCSPDTEIESCARMMADARVSSIGVTEHGKLMGIVTVRDMTNKVLAKAVAPSRPVRDIMTADPVSLPPHALGSDILHVMLEHQIGHLPVVENGKFVGMVTQTDITRFHGSSQTQMIYDLTAAETVADMAAVTERLPQFLMQLVGAHLAHDVVTRKITDVADILTRKLVRLAEAKLGPAPVPFLWAACGSQGRREQTGVSDQDNCLIIDDAATPDDMAYFEALAAFVCDGLNTCGYVYCPGDMMATNPRWRQRVSVWERYFEQWIAKPDNEAQMLASVMFDLRPIAGQMTLFDGMQERVLHAASKNSIFVAHMISNSLKHHPPLGLLRGFATVKSGEHRNTLDMKMNGVVPIVDLGRIYALQGRLSDVNTRARIGAAIDAGVISETGGQDLLAAYDIIATTRLAHQAALVKSGARPDNFLPPSSIPAFERSHLRDAFVIVRTMQSSASGSGVRT